MREFLTLTNESGYGWKEENKERTIFLRALLLAILDCHTSALEDTFNKALSQEMGQDQRSEYGLGGSQWKVMGSPSGV